MKIQVNGRWVSADPGEMILDVLRREKIEVPALCDHPAVEPHGACRLCTVEITKEDWKGWKGNVTSCLYPVEDRLVVATHTPAIIELRRTLLDLLLARCPNSEVIQKLAQEFGVSQTSYEPRPDADDCILCALCTRVCAEMGFYAISTIGRGYSREIGSPLKEPPPDCTGCLACANICPTSCIPWSEQNGTRTIWERTFELIACKECGKTIITRELADHLIRHRQIQPEYFDTCDDCKRKNLARTMGPLVGWKTEVKAV